MSGIVRHAYDNIDDNTKEKITSATSPSPGNSGDNAPEEEPPGARMLVMASGVLISFSDAMLTGSIIPTLPTLLHAHGSRTEYWWSMEAWNYESYKIEGACGADGSSAYLSLTLVTEQY